LAPVAHFGFADGTAFRREAFVSGISATNASPLAHADPLG